MLWAITTYFNPCRYKHRLANYHLFRSLLDAPLITIELGFDDHFELSDDDADVLVRASDGDVMFQKERLLNTLVGHHLPDDCDVVAWLDCDVVLLDSNWKEDAVRLLDEHTHIQLFDQVRRPESSISSVTDAVCLQAPRFDGVVRTALEGRFDAEKWIDSRTHMHHTRSGLAWAARRDWLQRIMFYDACVVGSGDRTVVGISLGIEDATSQYICMNREFADHYRQWVRHVHAQGDINVGFLPGIVVQLWHGNYQNRSYHDRHRFYNDFGYDPASHLRLGCDGAWRWTDPACPMAKYVADYFKSRQEDAP